MNLLLRPVSSSLGRKYFMALTGFALILFVLVHMAGNLLVFAGRDALNSYAQALKHNPGLLWSARTGLLIVFLIHLVLGLWVTKQNSDARPVAYAYDRAIVSTWASRHMLCTGLVLLAFILYHLAHFTFGAVSQAQVKDPLTGQMVEKNYLDLHEAHDPKDPHSERHDVYSMVIAGFRQPVIVALYVLAQFFLALHLWHGASSWFQSLGLNHPRYNPFFRGFGPVIATVVFIGNSAMPLAVYLCHALNVNYLRQPWEIV